MRFEHSSRFWQIIPNVYIPYWNMDEGCITNHCHFAYLWLFNTCMLQCFTIHIVWVGIYEMLVNVAGITHVSSLFVYLIPAAFGILHNVYWHVHCLLSCNDYHWSVLSWSLLKHVTLEEVATYLLLDALRRNKYWIKWRLIFLLSAGCSE